MVTNSRRVWKYATKAHLHHFNFLQGKNHSIDFQIMSKYIQPITRSVLPPLAKQVSSNLPCIRWKYLLPSIQQFWPHVLTMYICVPPLHIGGIDIKLIIGIITLDSMCNISRRTRNGKHNHSRHPILWIIWKMPAKPVSIM